VLPQRDRQVSTPRAPAAPQEAPPPRERKAPEPEEEVATFDSDHDGVAQAAVLIAAAKAAFPAWAAKPIAERRALLHKMADVIDANADEIARLLTLEQGKPLMFATGEVRNMAADVRALVNLELPVKVLEDSDTRRAEQHRRRRSSDTACVIRQ